VRDYLHGVVVAMAADTSVENLRSPLQSPSTPATNQRYPPKAILP
jgi:hypothetical protein